MCDLKKFIENNNNIVMRYHKRHYESLCALSADKIPYQKIRLLFANAMNASGGNPPVDSKKTTYENFKNKINTIEGKEKLSFDCFGGLFIENFSKKEPRDKIQELTRYFESNNEYPHFAHKKSSLFVKELILLGGDDIFSDDISEYKKHLYIPVDRVVNIIFTKIKNTNKIAYINQHLRSEIQNFAQEIFQENPILLDDFWFWGHFSITKNRDGNTILKNPNDSLIHTDEILMSGFQLDEIKEKCREFIKIISSKSN